MADHPLYIAPSAAELETLKASAAQCGHTFAKIGRALSDGFTGAAFRWQQAEARRWEQWHRKQRNDIRRQQLALDTTYFGRKRRARRARGRATGASS